MGSVMPKYNNSSGGNKVQPTGSSIMNTTKPTSGGNPPLPPTKGNVKYPGEGPNGDGRGYGQNKGTNNTGNPNLGRSSGRE